MGPSRPLTETKVRLKELCLCDIGKWYEFTKPVGEGRKVVHRIRVELSRIKAALRRRGVQINNDFKLIARIEAIGNGMERVKLTRVKEMADLEVGALSELEQMLAGVDLSALETEQADKDEAVATSAMKINLKGVSNET